MNGEGNHKDKDANVQIELDGSEYMMHRWSM